VRAALSYAARGWDVFPCHSIGGAGRCSCCRPDCASPAKHPRIAGGLTAATSDPSTIQQWWRRWPTANVAVRTGAASGIVVLDIDPDHGGDETLAHLLDEHGPVPTGAVVHTGSGGRHVYFAHPGGLIRNDTGRRLGPGLDIRGDGGYVIAPPSGHANGRSYRWHDGDRTLPNLPYWLLGRLRDAVRPTAVSAARHTPTHDPTAHSSSWARAALERELARVAAAKEGTRNDTLNRSSFSLGQIVGSGRLDAAEVEQLLLDRAFRIGLGEREARATIASGLSAGSRQPRSPAARTIDLRTVPLPGTPSSRSASAASAPDPAPKPTVADVSGP
jgi:hypothetical protein